jgi:two-component system, chemotaxis family, chemotaxis protein CheY
LWKNPSPKASRLKTFPLKKKPPWFEKGIEAMRRKVFLGEARPMDKIIDFRMKVLVVDDFATMRKIVRNILKQIGFEDITEAEDGSVALRLIKSESVGLVVTDWNMPNMSGLDLLREIRQNPQTASLPVLMVTAEGLKENVMDAVKAGVNNYVVKPFTAEVLQEKIETIFRKQASA